jgi:hypothetical protein
MTRRALAAAILLARRVRVVSYQNSGRTWLRVMLSDLGIRPKFTHAGAAYRYRLPPEHICDDLARYTGCNVLFLARNPLDAIVSNYFQAMKTDKVFDGDISAFVRDPRWGLARMLAFNAGWYAARDRFRGFHLVRYETLVAQTSAELAKIVAFMRVPFIGAAEIERAAVANQFDAMKQREMTGELFARFGDRFKEGGSSGDESLKVRRGKVGGYRDYLGDDDVAYCTQLIAATKYPL